MAGNFNLSLALIPALLVVERFNQWLPAAALNSRPPHLNIHQSTASFSSNSTVCERESS
jgi:hypothetical protein